MSKASFMEKLLDGVEVEWKALGEVCDFKNGFAFKSSLFKEAGLPIVRITNVDGKNISLADVKYFDPSDYKENTASYEVNKGDILIAMSGATTGKIGFYAHENPAYLNQRVGKFLPKPKILNNRYLYHYLLSKVEQIYVIAGGGAQPNLSSNALMAKIQIPIPCPDNSKKSLEIQAEIVRILDAFTAMTAELTAELNLSKKQYNYYRDQLLSFEEGEVEWKTLGEMCLIGDGLHGTPTYDEHGDYFFINGNNLDSGSITFTERTKKVNGSMFEKHGIEFDADNTVFLSINGTIGNVAFYSGENIVLGKSVAFFKIKSTELNLRYLFHFLQTNFSRNYFELNKTGSTIKNLGLKALRAFNVPVPPLSDQARIVAILDKFDALTNSITEGLPREIELRQQQYEYYRDLLLSFPKPDAEVAA